MSLRQNWEPEQVAWTIQALKDLESDGTMRQAADWDEFKNDLTEKLNDNGAGTYTDELVEQVEREVSGGQDFRQLVPELESIQNSQATEAATPQVATPEVAVARASGDQATAQPTAEAFTAALPNAADFAA